MDTPQNNTHTAQAPSRGFSALAKKHFTLKNALNLLLFGLFCYAFTLFVVRGASNMGYFWQWYRLSAVFLLGGDGSFFSGSLWRGLETTLRLSLFSLIPAILLALLVTEMRLSGGIVEKALAVGYVQFIRNTPLLVQILFMYFVLAPFFDFDAQLSAIIALTLFEGAYMSEIFRGGFLSVGWGQWEAAYSLGLSRFTVVRAIILPQAVRNVLPPLLSQCVSLVKDSSLASVISVAELTHNGKVEAASSLLALEIWLTVALVYLALSLILSGLAWLLRLYLRRGDRGGGLA